MTGRYGCPVKTDVKGEPVCAGATTEVAENVLPSATIVLYQARTAEEQEKQLQQIH